MPITKTGKTKIRETFGILDKQGNLYPDLYKCHIRTDYFFPVHLSIPTIWERGIEYILQMDSRLRRALTKKIEIGYSKEQKVIISFQQRTDINIALARIYENPQTRQTGEKK